LLVRDFYEGTGPTETTLAEELRKSPEYLGLAPKVDLDRLIEALYVSPVAPAWFLELVRSIVARYGLSRDLVRQSQLAGAPVY
jgi:hypothetical protein